MDMDSEKLAIPAGTLFDGEKALELANLIERAYEQFACYELADPPKTKTAEEWNPSRNWEPAITRRLMGSTTAQLDIPSVEAMCKSTPTDSPGQVEYEVLDTFAHTLYWFEPSRFFSALKLPAPERVPFGFIARRIQPGETVPTIYVVFRGTLEPAEWVNNFLFRQTPFKPHGLSKSVGNVSRGFNRIYTRDGDDLGFPRNLIKQFGGVPEGLPGLDETVETVLKDKEKCPREAQVYVTGHSLGGALSTLATAHIAALDLFDKPPILYTYASPRAGDEAFAHFFDDQKIPCFRVANSTDVVPHVPPAVLKAIGEDITGNTSLTEDQKQKRKSGFSKVSAVLGLMNRDGGTGVSLKEQEYVHVGVPLYFTKNMGSISYNHNMHETYRQALPTWSPTP